MNSADGQELERQLRLPTGEKGRKLGQKMNVSNKQMIDRSIGALDLQPCDRVLELGHGAAGHLAHLMQAAQHIRYVGLELSPLMQQEAKRASAQLAGQHDLQFELYDGSHIPYPDQAFSKVLTVNTLYFWPQPTQFLAELARVLRPGGTLVITYMHKEFMAQLPFVGEQFTLYGTADVAKLAAGSPLRIAGNSTYTERAKSKAGTWVDRVYTVARLRHKL